MSQHNSREHLDFTVEKFMAKNGVRELKEALNRKMSDLSWSPETGQRGSLTQNQENDQHVKKETSAQCRVEIARRA